ncbi:13779_t:CDS:2 [Entrophospora sp. SA101]|nr:13779_t:CDS:2 [Entrophospora sp. SA101]
MSKPSIHFCTKYTIDKMRNSGQTPTLTELQQAILSEAKYNSNWSAAVILFEDFDRIVWERLTRLLDKNNDKTTGQSNKQTLKEIWLQTSIALQPLSITELKYVRQVYQIMVRYAPTIKDVSYYYLHLLKNHIETPILDAEVVNHCLNSLIYHISLSKDTDYLTRGLDLVKIALGRNMGTDKNNVLQSVSKGILKFNGVRITKNGKNIEKERPNDNNFDEKNAENDEWNKKEYPPNCQQIQQEQDNSEVIGSLFIKKYNNDEVSSTLSSQQNYKFDELESETEFIIDGHKNL